MLALVLVLVIVVFGVGINIITAKCDSPCMAELISWHKCLAAILDDAPTGLITRQSARDRWLQIFDKKPKAQLSVVLVLVSVFEL